MQKCTSLEQQQFLENVDQNVELPNEEAEENDSDSDKFSEIDEQDNLHGNSDTLLDDENVAGDQSYTFAPGEGEIPLNMSSDSNAEYLAFPTKFCGQTRISNDERLTPVHYSENSAKS